MFQALEISSGAVMSEETVNKFFMARKFFSEKDWNLVRALHSRSSNKLSKLVDILRSTEKSNVQYDLKCISDVLKAPILLYEFTGSIKYGEDYDRPAILLYRYNVGNVFLPIVAKL